MYYPALIDLQGQRCVVVGGGDHAAAKVTGLLDAGAEVSVIARSLVPDLDSLNGKGKIKWIMRDYQHGDLDGAFLVISTLMTPDENRKIRQEAIVRNLLVNAVDDVPNCNFIAPSIVRRGDLTVAISTSGKAPALAVRLRQRFEQMLGQEYARFLELAGTLRNELVQRYPDFKTRKTRWYELVDSDVLSLLKQGDEAQAQRRIKDIVNARPKVAEGGAKT